jgi:Xaa-Pro dipeptidase
MNKERMDTLTRHIKEAELGGMLISPSEEMLFLTGFSPMMCERFQGLFISDKGEAFYVCNRIYAGEIERAFSNRLKIFSWEDGESMTDVVGKALTAHGMSGKTLGVNSSAQGFNVLDIMEKCGVRFVNALGVIEEARIIKTKKELDLLRMAAAMTDEAFARALDFIKPGLAEADILSFLERQLTAAGGTNFWGIIASGPNSSYPHYHGTSRIIEKQDLMILDFGCACDGLYSDMSRMVFVGGITEEQKAVYGIVREAQEAAETAAVSGAFIPDVDEAARGIIRRAGYGEYFFNRVGHGIGYMVHEAPDIKKNNRRTLLPGMAFSIEPGIYQAGKFGMRIENILVATENGNEVLNKASKEIIIL